MNIVFLGSSKFAVPSLEGLVSSSHNIICVVTQPDRPAGRGLDLISTPVANLNREFNLPLHQTDNVNSQESLQFFRRIKPDLLCVVAFGQILSQKVLEIPKIFSINLHASLLPKYRGAAPVRWAIINGESHTGLTVIKLEEELDAGPIILQEKANIEDYEDALSLEERLSHVGAKLLLRALDLIQEEKYNLIPQNENDVTLAPKLKKQDGLIYWDNTACDIFNLVRGCIGWPGAFTSYRGKILKVHKVKVLSGFMPSTPSGPPGQILDISKNGIAVLTGDGSLLVEEVQVEGKKRVKAAEFVSGYKVSVGEKLGEKK